MPHTSSLIDLDGDCLSDLFLTVKDVSTGNYYYEIYLRREQSTLMDIETEFNFTGLNSFCLVAREEIPEKSMFKFTDVDRDGMIDMIHSYDLNLNIHYNRLLNEMRL
jgi:predicted PilT family ATPase